MKSDLECLQNYQMECALTRLGISIKSDIAAYIRNTQQRFEANEPNAFAVNYLLLESLFAAFSTRIDRLREIQRNYLQDNKQLSALEFAIQELMEGYCRMYPEYQSEIFLKKNPLDVASKDLRKLDNRINFLRLIKNSMPSITYRAHPEKIWDEVLAVVINRYDNIFSRSFNKDPLLRVLKNIREAMKTTKNNLGNTKAANLLKNCKRHLDEAQRNDALDFLGECFLYREELLFHLSYANDGDCQYKNELTVSLAKMFHVLNQAARDYNQQLETEKKGIYKRTDRAWKYLNAKKLEAENRAYSRMARTWKYLESEAKIYLRYLTSEQLATVIKENPSVLEDPSFLSEINKKYPDFLPDEIIIALRDSSAEKQNLAYDFGKFLLDRRYVVEAMAAFSSVLEKDPHYKEAQFELKNFKFLEDSSSISLSELTNGAHGIKDRLLDEKVELEKRFLEQLNIIKFKADDLRNNNHQNAADCALNLHGILQDTHQKFIAQEINKQAFRKICFQALNEAKPELEKHRGWKQLLGNLALAILGLGVFYVVAGIINKAKKGSFLFFQTDSANKLEKLEQSLCRYSLALS